MTHDTLPPGTPPAIEKLSGVLMSDMGVAGRCDAEVVVFNPVALVLTPMLLNKLDRSAAERAPHMPQSSSCVAIDASSFSTAATPSLATSLAEGTLDTAGERGGRHGE